MAKDAILHIRISAEQKARIEAEARKQDVTTAQYVIEALDFYSTLDVHFLESMHMTAEKVKLPMSKVIQNLLVAYINTELAQMDFLNTGGITYQRAFQWDKDGLIEGIKHMDLTYNQAKEEYVFLREKLEKANKDGQSVLITHREAALIAPAFAAAWKKKQNQESSDHLSAS